METLPSDLKPPLVEFLLSLADDKLMLGQRNSDWTGLGPILEEDIAFSALAQDDLAHAMAIYEFIASFDGRRADDVAYGRANDAYRCASIVEISDEFDWAVAISRQFFCDHFEALRLESLSRSSFAPLAALASRMLAEERLSLGHADSWVARLAKANSEARARVEAALRKLAPLTGELFEPTAGLEKLEAAGVYPYGESDMHTQWRAEIEGVLGPAQIRLELKPPAAGFVGGRLGRHSESFTQLLDEMCEVYRVEPNASW